MYKKILVALDIAQQIKAFSPTSQILPGFIIPNYFLSMLPKDGRRHYTDFLLKESEEMIKDRQYLENAAKELRAKGLEVKTVLALGEPSLEILRHCRKGKMRPDCYDVPRPSLFSRPLSGQHH